MFGKAVAREGDMVSCPIQGHGSCPIIEGDPSWDVDGKAVALEGHKTACGAVLFSSMPEVSRSYEGSGAASSGAPRPIAAKALTAASVLAATSGEFDQHFLLQDEITGAPLVNRMYRIKWSGGEIEGRTDEHGHTQKTSSGKAEEVTIEVFAENP
ncbi:PAAR domain-containing protein [Iodobacter sp. CM08]|uniref:PAAR domain-containing protein n=1 Tax=Iodobacter sp. CM08 TaxID=3085902 RepID=UPI00298106F2|nr:PAAR domain-containing protein [Iodobacter sp. CM08]MDW5418592.1 PAAR domain-containing protein [Iodobacter sp. CM08]